MTDVDRKLEQLGQEVDAVLDVKLTVQQRDSQLRALTAVATAPSRTAPRQWPWLAAAAVLLAVGIGAVVLTTGGSELSYTVGDGPTISAAGRWIENSTAEGLPVRFTDGSELALEPSATARIVSMELPEVRVDVSGGRIAARIQPDQGLNWLFEVGPYRITVLGTELSVDWNAESARLEVVVQRGSVLVEGEQLAQGGVKLGAGERLLLDSRRKTLALSPAGVRKPPQPTVATEQEEVEPSARGEGAQAEVAGSSPPAIEENRRLSADEPERAGTSIESDHASAAERVGWHELFDSGSYAAAVSAAKEEGVDRLLVELDREELWQLGDAARYTKDGVLATRVLEKIRQRFRGSARTRTAAFLLGRVALELNGDPAAARGWFETYLREDAGGPLDEEARGRLIDACDKSGARAAARRAARDYLERYPEGLFSQLAQSVRDEQ